MRWFKVECITHKHTHTHRAHFISPHFIHHRQQIYSAHVGFTFIYGFICVLKWRNIYSFLYFTMMKMKWHGNQAIVKHLSGHTMCSWTRVFFCSLLQNVQCFFHQFEKQNDKYFIRTKDFIQSSFCILYHTSSYPKFFLNYL